MKYDKIVFQNIGPIEKGEIKRNKINVFFGSNNSGKSIASRLIYGVGQSDTKNNIIQKMIKKTPTAKEMNMFYGYNIISHAGIRDNEITTQERSSGGFTMYSPTKLSKIKFTVKKNMRVSKEFAMLHHYAKRIFKNSKDSVYIPAGRTGIIQFFTSITQIRNRLLQDLLDSFPSGDKEPFQIKKTSSTKIKNFAQPSNKLPEHLEQFHELVLDAHAKGINKEMQDLFSNIFSGTIDSFELGGFPELIYKDPTGFVTRIESAGSGIVSSFPIVIGIHYVNKGGTLIIEEPEINLEPARQLKLIEEIVSIAAIKKIDLVFTTHSDYVVKKLLAMVSSKKIKHTDLGLYYFNRTSENLTEIERVSVDETGEAEQTLFEDALDTLVEEYSE